MSTNIVAYNTSSGNPGDEHYAAVPQELRERQQWICWRRGESKDDGRFEKEPIDPRTGRMRGATDQQMWVSFDEAVAAVERHGLGGISFVPLAGGEITFVDFDKCLNEKGEITKPWVREWVEKANTYTEVSPSGTGLRAVAFGALPRSINNPDMDVEMYSADQQLTITGDRFWSAPSEVRKAQGALTELFEEYNRKGGHRDLAIDESEPPVRLSEYALSIWRGDRPKRGPGGSVDRSGTLYKICCELAKAGATAKAIRNAAAERDAALGFRKYLDRTDEQAERRYTDLAVGALEKVGAEDSRKRDPKTPQVVSAADLMQKEFEPLKWVVPDILPEGVSLLVGKAKIGKSWMGLGLGVGVAKGSEVFGKAVEKGPCLYLALEDNERRLQRRLGQSLRSGTGPYVAPEGFDLATEWPRIGEGFEEALREWLDEHPGARLVVVDTLKKVRPQTSPNRSVYEVDYEALEPLLPVAAEYGVAIVVVHHARKTPGDGDVLDEVSGSTGLTGGVDGILLLKRERGKHDATLFTTGRDVEEDQELALRWNNSLTCWELLGNAEDCRRSDARNGILEALEEAGQPMSRTDLALEVKGKSDDEAIRKVLRKMRDQGEIEMVGPQSRPLYTLPRQQEGESGGGSNSPTTPSSPIHPSSPSSPSDRTDPSSAFTG